MSGVTNSFSDFFGTGRNPNVDAQTGNGFLQQLGAYTGGKAYNPDQMAYEQSFINPSTGSDQATSQVLHNPLLSQGLNTMQGQLQTGQDLQSGQTGILNNLQNQGFELKPEDQTLYGQTSGNIARMFGQQGNQAANSLAQRGLSNSGAAGAMFSGIQGNQNEMLAQAQQQIMQQRFQNTMSQIQQQQSFVNSLNSQNNQAAGNLAGQGASDIQQQYGRQLAGGQQYTGALEAAAGLQNQANQVANQGNLGAAGFNTTNKPYNIGDMGIQAGMAGVTGGMFGGGGAGAGAGGAVPPTKGVGSSMTAGI